jgi:hypothetical protein
MPLRALKDRTLGVTGAADFEYRWLACYLAPP